jgi:glycosyltransferase involved in cell wall biosynthesis
MLSNSIDKISKEFPLVSIIAISYNHERFLEETLNSIKAQTYPNIQLVIMDDCSEDSSVKKIEDWIEKNNLDCKFIVHKKNQGVCKTLNESLKYCDGKYLQFIACDDILIPEKIEIMSKVFESESDTTCLIYSDGYMINEEGEITEETFFKTIKPKKGNVFNDLIENNFVPAPSILYKRASLLAVGGFNEQLIYEDWDILLRLSLKHTFKYVNLKTVYYRIHKNSLWHSENVHFYDSTLLSHIKFVNVNTTAREIVIKRIKNFSVRIYKLNPRMSRKWFLKWFLLEPSFKAFILLLFATLNRKYNTSQKLVGKFNFIFK